jgi:hypothetical protein
MLRNLSEGEPACLTVTHLDSLVLARCGFNHSADYRAVMAFGHARLVEEPAEKERSLVMMVDRFFPRRTAQLRQSSKQEIKATAVIYMDIEKASAKIRAKGVADDDEDYLLPIYAERLPVHTVLGAPRSRARGCGPVSSVQKLLSATARTGASRTLCSTPTKYRTRGLTCDADALASRNEKSRDEPLQSKPGSKPLHHPLSLSDGKVRIHRPTVGSLMGAVFDLRHYLAPGGGI